MNTNSPITSARRRLARNVSVVCAFGALAVSVFAQAPVDPNAAPNANGGGRRNRDQAGNPNGGNGGGRGNFDPAQMQERMMTAMRERMGVTDDAEWALISERVTKVTEARMAAGGGGGGGGALGMMMGRGGPGGAGGGGGQGGGGGNNAGGRGGRQGGTPEMASLRAALEDKLPEAEIKSRLARLREVRKENEAKLTKAQEDLRAVLTVPQEAMLVMAGLLP